MPEHTKRSATFYARVQRAIGWVRRVEKSGGTLDFKETQEIRELLEGYTVDSHYVVKAAEDEPIFVLRGQDRLSPALVLAWAQLHDEAKSEQQGKPEIAYEGTERGQDAVEVADMMARYRRRRYPS